MERLIKVLKERDIPLGQDDVQWAFESVKTKDDIVRWVEEYLNEPTLLTKDELEMYVFEPQLTTSPTLMPLNRYDRIGRAAVLPENDILPVHERELTTTIQLLQESTNAIEAHAKTLEAQLEALRALQSRREATEQLSQKDSNEKKKRTQESDRAKFAAEDALAQLNDDTASTQKSLRTASASLVASTTHRLNSDDRTIAAIEKLLPNVEKKPVDPGRNDSVEQWCRALASFQAAELKARIQTTYENALRDAMEAGDVDGEGNLAAEQKSLEDELNSLYNEVASVTQMVVDYELRTPIIKSLDTAQRQSTREQRQWTRYVGLSS